MSSSDPVRNSQVWESARQRAAYASGGLQQVVDTLLKETRADTDLHATAVLGN